MSNSVDKGIEIRLPANAENVSLVRHAISGAAESLGIGEVALADLQTVVTEACMNVAQHAYDDPGGPMEVLAWPEGDELVIVVSDSGQGIRPQADSHDGSLRLGLSLIASMTSGFEIAGSAGSGTRVMMRVGLEPDGAEPPAGSGSGPSENGSSENGSSENGSSENGSEGAQSLEAWQAGAVALTAWDVEALSPIVGRVVSVLAARSDLSVDELSDAVLFSDAISGDIARMEPGSPVRLSLVEEDDVVVLRIGPLAEGDAARLRSGLSLPGELGGTLESLAGSVSIGTEPQGEYLEARFGAG